MKIIIDNSNLLSKDTKIKMLEDLRKVNPDSIKTPYLRLKHFNTMDSLARDINE